MTYDPTKAPPLNRRELPAFPVSLVLHRPIGSGVAPEITHFPGMTIREEFASRMLAALLPIANHASRGQPIPAIVDAAVDWADALIERLSQPQEVPK